ncbi:MAG: class I SAM-dependent methyltransferase [Chlorobiaceae bacterium]|nr:class I SAM-dependent methyltransferase [Chlorobiaceae bacterium]
MKNNRVKRPTHCRIEQGEVGHSDKFDREARQWDDNPQRKVLAQCVAKAIIAAAKPAKSMLALEFGCGTGLVTLEIAPLVKRLYAVDTSREMVAILRDKIDTCRITNIEASCLDILSPSANDFDEKRFDLMYCSMTLHHIDDTEGFLSRISHLLSPGGMICIADLVEEDGLFHDDPLEKVHRGFDRDGLAAMLKAAGLEPTSFEIIHTFNKINRSGATAAYPVFLVTATNTISS